MMIPGLTGAGRRFQKLMGLVRGEVDPDNQEPYGSTDGDRG